MIKLQTIEPPFPTGKIGSFVSSKRSENPIKITYMVNPEEKNTLYGEVNFLPGAEGPPGHVHGGCQAAVLDETMGSCCWANNLYVVAKKIEVEFIDMLPLTQTYKLVSSIEKIDGRKVFVTAKITIDEKDYAKSTGLFIVLD
ncbi:MAG: PaaI family thioesterase, partial [Bdellovibrionales bacterium]|nr:PaaI family thioesterase [Bdellovibrionales bacterium]